MVAPRALVFRPLVKGNEALGTRLGDLVKFDFEHAYRQQGPIYGPCCYCECVNKLLGIYGKVSISFPEAAILLVSDWDRDLWPELDFESANHGHPVTLRRIKGKPQTDMLWVISTSGCYAFVFQLFNSQ